MIWQTTYPSIGDTRTRSLFTWFPYTVRYYRLGTWNLESTKTYWLERITVEERFSDTGLGFGKWRAVDAEKENDAVLR